MENPPAAEPYDYVSHLKSKDRRIRELKESEKRLRATIVKLELENRRVYEELERARARTRDHRANTPGDVSPNQIAMFAESDFQENARGRLLH